MLKKIVIALLVIILGILGYAATKPDTFRVERSVSINAPAERIFPMVNDFHQWPLWSPFEKLDTALQRTVSGAPSGQGTVYEWSGNKDVGQGRMEIIESFPSSKIGIKLDFIKPMEATSTAEFTFVPQGNATTVTWAMFGPNTYVGKVMSVFMDMDKMVGKDFESGLAKLKQMAELAPPVQDTTIDTTAVTM